MPIDPTTGKFRPSPRQSDLPPAAGPDADPGAEAREIDEAARVGEDDVAKAAAWWREHAGPDGAGLIDAKEYEGDA